MTIKERIINKLNGIEFGNDFLEQVGGTWIEHLEDNDLDDIVYEIKSVIEYGANNGNVNFVIYTKDNEKFVGENLSEVFEYINEVQNETGIIEDLNADSIMHMAVRDCALIIDNCMSLSIEDYEEDEEIKTEELTAMEIVGIFQEVRESKF